MANFPTSLDTSVTIPVESASTPLSTNHVTNHTASQTAIIALETKVGVDGSAVTSSHDYKLSEILTTDKAVGKSATQTLTNKTLTSPTITGATITTSTLNGVTLQTAGSATDFLAANGTYQAGAVTNASSTVKGIVELATTAEINAGTATGGTGAALVVTPDQLALSTPVFNGSGLTNTIQGFVTSDVTNTTVTNTTTETSLMSYALAGGILSTNKAIRFRASMSAGWTASGSFLTLRVKYGATTLATFTIDPVSGVTQTGEIVLEGVIQGAGTTSTQESSFSIIASGLTDPNTPVFVARATSAEDSTASKNIVISAQWENASSSLTTTIYNYLVQKIV